MIRNAVKFAIPLLALLIVGCRAAVPVYNVESAPVAASKPVSAQDVEKAITRAAGTMGWKVVPRGAGKMEGTLELRTHRAVVDIEYNAKQYSIKYKDSANLQYDGTNIHQNYNGWVQNLDKAIRAQLSAM